MIAYFDCFSGISGDMILGALVDAGVSTKKLKNELSRLPINGYTLRIKNVKRGGFSATKVDVVLRQGKKDRGKGLKGKKFKDIESVIKKSSLSKGIKQKGLAVFKKLFKAEAEVHGERFDKIHLHELGAVDCIIDIFGALVGLEILGIKEIYSSPVNLGSGTVKTEHGDLPVPAPATAELLRNIPVYSTPVSFELTTPTGAAVISSLADDFGSMPEMQISSIGLGAGVNDFKKQPNILRLFVGQSPIPSGIGQGTPKSFATGRADYKVTVIETNIDDMNPQVYEYLTEKLFKGGALDVFLTQIIMKKGRPGIKLSVLCDNNKKEVLMGIIFRETTSIGLRFYEVHRKTLEREVKSVNTRFGKVNVKISQLGSDVLKSVPEYEDCRKIAKKYDIPLIDVYTEVAGRPACRQAGSKPASRSERVARKKHKN